MRFIPYADYLDTENNSLLLKQQIAAINYLNKRGAQMFESRLNGAGIILALAIGFVSGFFCGMVMR